MTGYWCTFRRKRDAEFSVSAGGLWFVLMMLVLKPC